MLKQDRIHGGPDRMRLGRGSDAEGQIGLQAGAVMQKLTVNAKLTMW